MPQMPLGGTSLTLQGHVSPWSRQSHPPLGQCVEHITRMPVDLWTCGLAGLWPFDPVDLQTCGLEALWDCAPLAATQTNFNPDPSKP